MIPFFYIKDGDTFYIKDGDTFYINDGDTFSINDGDTSYQRQTKYKNFIYSSYALTNKMV